MEENIKNEKRNQNVQAPSQDSSNKKKKEHGALWIRKSKQGNSFLSGSVKTESGEEVKIVIFKNSYKQEGSNQPDYRIYLDESSPSEVSKSPTGKPQQASSQEVPESDDIPF